MGVWMDGSLTCTVVQADPSFNRSIDPPMKRSAKLPSLLSAIQKRRQSLASKSSSKALAATNGNNKRGCGKLEQFRLLFKRSWRQITRSKGANIARAGAFMHACAFIWTIYMCATDVVVGSNGPLVWWWWTRSESRDGRGTEWRRLFNNAWTHNHKLVLTILTPQTHSVQHLLGRHLRLPLLPARERAELYPGPYFLAVGRGWMQVCVGTHTPLCIIPSKPHNIYTTGPHGPPAGGGHQRRHVLAHQDHHGAPFMYPCIVIAKSQPHHSSCRSMMHAHQPHTSSTYMYYIRTH